MSLENVTHLWRRGNRSSTTTIQQEARNCTTAHQTSNNTTTTKCPFSWFSGLSKQGENETLAAWLFSTSNSDYVSKNTGWTTDTGVKKLGISPKKKDAEPLMILEWTFAPPISTVTLFYMKSYGPMWEGSQVSLQVTADSATIQQQQQQQQVLLVGHHDKQTSETYTHRMEFEPTQTTTHVSIQLMNGTTFKIMGLAI